MAEQRVVVCDVCGEPAEQSVTFKVGNRSLAQDLCLKHLQELIQRSHPPKRGRRPGTLRSAGPARASRPSGSAKSRTKAPRRKITDPSTLEKRRAALEKARQALAKKRAAAKKAG